MSQDPTRREFLQSGIAAGTVLSLADALLAAQKDDGQGLPTRPLGKTGVEVSIIGLGGWDIGRLGKDDGEGAAIDLMHAAIDNGLTFFDNCWDYHDGYSEDVMGRGIEGRRDKVFLMTKNCERDYQGSLKCLEDSLRRLKTDHLDQALGVGRDFKPMSADEMDRLREQVKDAALDGRHEMFKTSKVFDGPHHRKQHRFDTQLNG